MTELKLRSLRRFPVTIGGITICLSSCRTVGVCVLREQCMADNTAAVTAAYPKGTRVTLEGWLAPAQDTAAVTAALAQRLFDGTQEDVSVCGLLFQGARLCSYAVHENQEHTAVTLTFYTASSPAKTEVEE